MNENRRIRFATIYGIDRMDLPLAAEVWVDDLRGQSWVSRDIIKIATVFKRYLSKPDLDSVRLSRIESTCQMDRKQVAAALSQMQMYGAIEAYSCDGGHVHASLNLTISHRLRVMETFERFAELQWAKSKKRKTPLAQAEEQWIPPNPARPEADAIEEDA